MNAQSPRLQTDAALTDAGLTQTVALNPKIALMMPKTADRSYQSSLLMFETLLSYGKARDPRGVLLALNAYLNANQKAHGIALFEGVLNQYRREMAPETQALYLSCLAILRATYADEIPLMRRIGWVKDSFALLQEALDLTGSAHPIPHWAAGMVFAQVPGFFGKRKAAYTHLNRLAARPESEPVYGFYREVYRQLELLNRADKNTAAADHFQRLSGFAAYKPNAMMMGWFVNGPEGTAMAPRPVLEQIVPDRVFALYGFGFSDIFFVLSEDGKELIAVDAGTHPRSLQEAHEYLLLQHPGLPQVSTVLVTHSHWDHIGGMGYFRALNPDLKIYGSDKYAPVVQRVMRTHSYSYFRGADFDHAWVQSYAPTHPVAEAQSLTIGGTDITLTPVTGGETEDAMLIHFPALSTVFVGDMVMPWYGEPWVNEGFVAEAYVSIDRVLDLKATHILHGHHPLTMMFPDANLRVFRDVLRWLVETTQAHISQGYSGKDIVRLNLIPETVVAHPDLYLAYVAARDSIILRVADSMVGIWREDHSGQSPEGLDLITAQEQGRLLQKYMGLSAVAAARLISKMIANGDNELALQFAIAAEQRYGAAAEIIAVKQKAADRLRSNAQYTDPFKFTTYSEIIARPQPPLPTPLPLSTKDTDK